MGMEGDYVRSVRAGARGPNLFGDDEVGFPEGFLYLPDFISQHEERELLDVIAKLEFSEVRMHGVAARRRIVQFGWRYRFDARALSEGRPLPPFLVGVRDRAASVAGVEPGELSEVLLTEYQPGATIGWHRDAPPFGLVVGVSLLSSCRFRLRQQEGDTWRRTERVLAPRSLYVLRGEVRSAWQHSIPAVASLRYSITFRTLRR